MMQEVEVLKTIQELICSFFSEEQFTLSEREVCFTIKNECIILQIWREASGSKVKMNGTAHLPYWGT